MSDIILFEVDLGIRFRFKDFIKIQCFVNDCESDLTEQFIPINAIINIDLLGDQKIKLFMCKKHFVGRQQTYQENKYHLNITICEQQIIKELKVVQSNLPKEIQLRNSQNKLNKNSCCIRENIKYKNLSIILEMLELASCDEVLISQLVKKMLLKKYFEFYELNNEISNISKQNNMNILEHLVLLHQYKQLIACMKSCQKESQECVVQSQHILGE